MKILVCGGRDFDNKFLLYSVLDFQRSKAGSFEYLIHGAARGADTLAGEWAKERFVPVRSFSADWDHYGKSAGHIRNAIMLNEGKPDLVIAFRGGKGTGNMIRQSEVANVPVIRYA